MRLFASLVLVGFLAAGPAGAALPAATVYKSPTCGCCEEYVRYLQSNGFAVTAVNRNDMDAVKARYGVPRNAQSCHTMQIGDYVVEGHVPVGAIRKLLTERPRIRGIAVPGMPPNSPGMGEMKPGTLPVHTIPGNGQPSRIFSVE